MKTKVNFIILLSDVNSNDDNDDDDGKKVLTMINNDLINYQPLISLIMIVESRINR